MSGSFLRDHLQRARPMLSQDQLAVDHIRTTAPTLSKWYGGHRRVSERQGHRRAISVLLFPDGADAPDGPANAFWRAYDYLWDLEHGAPVAAAEEPPSLARRYLDRVRPSGDGSGRDPGRGREMGPPDDVVGSRLRLDTNAERAHHYTARPLRLMGRKAEEKTLVRFLEPKAGFLWLQIAGAGGQGKSRFALEYAISSREKGWNAGFLSVDDLSDFSVEWRTWRPGKPTLIIIDYVIGNEREVGKAMRRLAGRRDLDQPVRLLLLERQRWDRGYLRAEDEERTGNFLIESGVADWFVALTAVHDGQDGAIQRARFSPSIIELTSLDRATLVSIVRLWLAKLKASDILEDHDIGASLIRIDPSGRPLYAYFLAEAISARLDVLGWSREDLLRATLTKDRVHRWSRYFSEEPPSLGDDVPASRLALLATLVGSLDTRDLAEGWDGGRPTARVLRQALALVDGPIGADVSGPGSRIPKLEPDILGGWFLLDSVAAGGVPMDLILGKAWELAPRETSATLLRLAQDFPRHRELPALLSFDPGSIDARRAYTDIALGLLSALRSQVNLHKIGVISRIQAVAETGDGYAMARLGLCYQEGIGVEIDLDRSLHWFERGAQAGNGRAMSYLGYRYFTGMGLDRPDLSAAIRWFEEGARAGDGQAMGYLGMCHATGRGVKRDPVEGMVWFHKGAEQGNGFAMTYLGIGYLQGLGVPRDPKRAFAWFKAAADAGGRHAFAYLGECYETGQGVPRDPDRAVHWYESGALEGSGHAMAALGRVFLKGLGSFKVDLVKAVEWLEKGVKANSGLAMSLLGDCHEAGLGVSKSLDRALALWTEAARLGDEDAERKVELHKGRQ
ncbi:tetratricopeptide repeat protein [Rhodospirillum sp. A1_3_36]|uniref:tetratricopeptide repeat protein n=1 Tax=Rhodospirillum sp. A1_3_36 TaxID=3391666 RepID=UPI0039A6C4B6